MNKINYINKKKKPAGRAFDLNIMLLIDTKIKQKPFRNVVLKLKSMRGFHWSEKVYYVAACKNRKIIVQDILNQYFKNLYST